MDKELNFKIIIEQDEDGVFVASVPMLPGCHSQGITYEEAIKNIKDAIKLCLKVAKEDPAYAKRINLPAAQFIGIADLSLKIPAFA